MHSQKLLWECKIAQSLKRGIWQYLAKLSMHLFFDTVTHCWESILKDTLTKIQKHICTRLVWLQLTAENNSYRKDCPILCMPLCSDRKKKAGERKWVNTLLFNLSQGVGHKCIWICWYFLKWKDNHNFFQWSSMGEGENSVKRTWQKLDFCR